MTGESSMAYVILYVLVAGWSCLVLRQFLIRIASKHALFPRTRINRLNLPDALTWRIFRKRRLLSRPEKIFVTACLLVEASVLIGLIACMVFVQTMPDRT